ncbi:MAG: hypothetical protein HFF22_07585 [Oscillospiraceae bacterium]|jgi:hypothetical protein|nr:hypothetical protein [Oscillospiraceae bacterium]MDE6956417.1 hypothetical protein [Oscillospiraceae bacterium]
MNQKTVKKINYVYLLLTILLPIALIALLGFVGYKFFPDGGTGAVICFMLPTALSVVWWLFGPSTIWKLRKKAMEQQLDQQGFTRNQTFYGSTHTVVVDIRKGVIALLFFWNPFESFIIPASRVTKAWTDDGAAGSGFLRGTSRVSFLFLIDGIKLRVDTFTSNQRWKMNDEHVLTGISKADMWVQVLAEAKEASELRNGTH